MPRRQVFDFVPDTYRGLLPTWLESPLAEEKHATCDACAMCAPAEPELPPDAYYSPDTKCCTYHPSLPNYAVGGLLCDDSAQGAEGRTRIERKLALRVGVTPRGIAPSAKQLLLYRHGHAGFGRASALVCPYLDGARGACTVWSQRDAVCATWFCKHNDGKDGQAFWTQLRDYLLGVQDVLIAVALTELGLSPELIGGRPRASESLDARELDDQPPSDASYAASWGPWLGRERELFIACHRIVQGLDRDAFERHAGIAHQVALGRLEAHYERMRTPVVPDPLLRNPGLHEQRMADGSYLLSSYSTGDLTRVRVKLHLLLDEFDGRRTTDEVRTTIRHSMGVGISEGLVRALYKHRVLVDPTDPTA